MSSLLLSVVEGPVSEPLTQFLVQVVVILVLVRLLAKLLHRIRQPMVIGEIIAGVLLGPSAFGQIPGFSDAIFPKSSLPILGLIANVALIFFMFFLGLEVEVGLMTKAWKSAAPTAVVSIVVPFLCGAAIAPWVASIDTPSSNSTPFLLFLGTAFSFTAFPVLARILTTNRMLSTSLGIQSLSCAAIDDVLAWCTLALTLSYATGGSAIAGLYTALIAIGFVLFLIFVVRPILTRIHRKLLERDDEMNKNFIAALFLLLCAASWFAQIIGIHAFFGAFAFGIIVPKEGSLHMSLAMRLELLIVEFLLPLYFAHSGLSTDVTRMNNGHVWAVCVVVCLLACVSKILPCTLMTRFLTGCFGFGYEAKSLKQLEEEQMQLQAEMDRGELGAFDAAAVNHHDLGLNGIEMVSLASKASSPNEPPKRPAASAASAGKRSPAGAMQLAPVPEFMVGDRTPTPTPGGRNNGHPSRRDSPIPSAAASPQPPPRSWDNWFGLKRYPPASWRLCLSVGVLMNTRGLVALIVLNIGLEKGILTVPVFTVMVIMSLATTLLTPPAIYALFVRQWDQQLLLQDEQKKRREAEQEQEKENNQHDYNEYLRYMAEIKQQRRQAASITAATASVAAASVAVPQLVQVNIVPFAAGDLPATAQSGLHQRAGSALPTSRARSVSSAASSPVLRTPDEAAERKASAFAVEQLQLQAAAAESQMPWPIPRVSPPPLSPDDSWLSTASFFRHVNLHHCSHSPIGSDAPHHPRLRSHPRPSSFSHSTPVASAASVSRSTGAAPTATVGVTELTHATTPLAAQRSQVEQPLQSNPAAARSSDPPAPTAAAPNPSISGTVTVHLSADDQK